MPDTGLNDLLGHGCTEGPAIAGDEMRRRIIDVVGLSCAGELDRLRFAVKLGDETFHLRLEGNADGERRIASSIRTYHLLLVQRRRD